MKKVSVIVPMYNAEKTIEECLSSLTAQSMFADMELLLVDDCSTDDTLARAMIFEKQYPENVVVIGLPENGGPGRARNIAMEYAGGEYVGFVDSDDAVVPVMYERLYTEAVRTGADVVDGGIYNKARNEAIVYTSDDLTGVMNEAKRSKLIASGGYICSKIFRRDFLNSENIRFREEYVLEDLDYILEVFCKMQIIANVKEILYVYRDSSDSLSKTIDVGKYLRSTTSAIKAIYSKLSCLQCYEGVREAVEYAMLQLYSYSVNIVLKSVKDGIKNRNDAANTLETLRSIKNEVINGGYDNRYVTDKMGETDIRIMRECDRDPLSLL